MTTLADVNVVFSILVEQHPHHAAAWKWWKSRDEASVGLCLPVRLGFLRLVSNATVMKGNPIFPGEALEAWDIFSSDPRTVWLEVPDNAHELHFRRLIKGRRASPNLWTDAWLAALSESLAIGLTSFDAGFHSFNLRDFELLKE